MIRPIQLTLIICVLLLPLFNFSQKIDSAYIYDTNTRASILSRDGAYTEAYALINDLITKLDQQTPQYLAYSYQTKSDIEINLGNYEQAIENSRKSLAIYLQLKDTFNIAYNYNLIGVGHYLLSVYDSTKIYYEKSYDLKKKIKISDKALAISAYNLAILYEDLAQPEKALSLYKEAEHYLLQDNNDHSFLPDVYAGLSHLYFYKKEIIKAEEYAEKAIDTGLKYYGEYNPGMTFIYTIYSNILVFQKKYKQAIDLHQKCLQIRENSFGTYHRWTCESNYQLAEVYELDKQFSNAEIHYQKAIEIGKKINSSQYLATAQTYLAMLYVEENKHLETSEKLLLEALDKNTKVFGTKNDIIADNYYYLAKIANKRKQKKKFFTFINQTFRSASYDKKNIQNVIAPYQTLDALVLMSDWFSDEYQASGDIKLLVKNFELIDQQLALIKFSQKNFSREQSKISFANEYRNVFEKGLNTCWKLYHKTKDKKYLEKAFELSETNRNTTLLEGLQDSKYKLSGDIPEDLLAYEKKIEQDLELVKIDLYYEKIAGVPDKELISDLLNQRILLSDKLDSLRQKFEIEFPRYSNLKYQNKIISISDAQNTLDKNTQLITYFLGAKNLFTFNISKDQVTFLKSEIAQEIIDKTHLFKKKLIARSDITDLSKDLYQYLLKQQLNKSKNKLVLIPDNVLTYLPFETLLNDQERFLINDHTISYSGSVRLFLELKNDFFAYKPPNYWAGFSPVYAQQQQLSANISEVSAIAEIVHGKEFIGEACKKQAFLNNNKDYSILHLAMHTKIDNENPMFNKLIFSDGELSASEIYLMKNRANLAVLSACDTGFGKLEKGEGVMSMARAFHFSGVPSVIMSLWKIPDKETKKIMISFYEHLEKGETKSEALKNAKLDYLASTEDKSLQHPYYWGGFVLNGNTNALEQTNNYYYLISGGTILLMLLFFGRKRSKQKSS